jgi:hypothetical protein
MNYLKLSVPPGVRWHGTAYQCENRWHDANLMRWDQGAMLPIGGWVAYVDTKPGDPDHNPEPITIPDEMVAREAHSWFLNDASGANGAGYYLGVATPKHLYSMSGLGDVTKLTDGLDLLGAETPVLNSGYGGGLYGKQSYGTPRQTEGQTKLPATTWTLDNYGEWLLAVSTTDQRIWCWKPNEEEEGDRFAELENAPRCLSLVATEERFVFALGADDGSRINVRRVAWSDREAPEEWAISPLNEAGGFELQTDGAIRCGLRVRGRTLILTTTDAHTATYSGPPLVYGFQQVGKNCGVISDRAAAATGAGAFWMGRDGFYTYDGSAVRELQCEVSDRVFRFMDNNSRHSVFAVANAKFNEIVWFYASSDAEGEEVVVDGEAVIKKKNNRYVSYDYSQNIWSIGAISRHAGVDSGIFNDPIWIDGDNNVWRQEIENAGHGDDYPWAESGPISIGEGDQVIKATQVLTDSIPEDRVTLEFKTRFQPQGDEIAFGPYAVKPQTDVRFTGRQMRMRINVIDDQNGSKDVRIGDMRVLVGGGGRR